MSETKILVLYTFSGDSAFRTVTDLEPIISPTEGILCLAQFSKDGNFYRAKVVELCSKGKHEIKFKNKLFPKWLVV